MSNLQDKINISNNKDEVPKLSILVPIYNAQKYLRQCLESLINQTLKEIEIICINDGSTDGSGTIIAEFAGLDNRIRVITKENSGYGDSMNQGLALARGTWVGICEPDDFCDQTMYKKLVQIAERWNCDIAKANYAEHTNLNKRDNLIPLYDPFPYKKPFSPHDNPRVLLTAPTIWAAIYRRSMIVENDIHFSNTPGASYQDASFAHQCWIAAQSVVFLREGLYRYRIDNDASSSKSPEKVFAICGEYDQTFEFLKARGVDDLKFFGPWVNVMRSGVYVWNYNRIAEEYHLPFVEHWVQDLIQADDEGLFNPAFFTSEYRDLLGEMLDNPKGFCVKYKEALPILPIM